MGNKSSSRTLSITETRELTSMTGERIETTNPFLECLRKNAPYTVRLSHQNKNVLLKADSRSGSQEIPSLLWNPKIHNSVHKRQQLELILSQMNPLYILLPYFFKIHFNIILLLTFRSPEWYLPSISPIRILYILLISHTHAS
jgi:hypothetical protein